ncbi:hypothetical protein [Amycolatopsis suaedae]|uniref:Uncharacterized protein n=1 Tax=Amycolatopsis suaedae TaxID=2510978 RepID=A0A4Q7JFD6_9PSEU|nr:hypothetical protein [Amycolatopsis suaedae]RZQ65264.1 hypothetical protein EWH70_05100 [Amycolatopsis suaedae]
MDDRELETLFRTAPGDAPAPTFTLDDVTARSRRQTARRRSTIIAACGFVVVVGLGAGVLGLAGSTEQTASAPGMAQQEQPNGVPARPPEDRVPMEMESVPPQSPMQGGTGTGDNGPRADSTFGCDKVDRELATALAGELPATGSTEASPGRVCTTGARSAGFPVAGGFVSATVFPPGTTVQLPPLTNGALPVETFGASGRRILVLSEPAPGSSVPPVAERDAQRIADTLAARF